jgi:hypothetical protein
MPRKNKCESSEKKKLLSRMKMHVKSMLNKYLKKY